MNKYSYLTLISLACVFLLMSSCGKKANAGDQENGAKEELADDIVELRDDQIKLIGLTTGDIEMRDLKDVVKANGKVSVAPEDIATVCMPMGGYVRSANIMQGDYVRKGQTLAVLENQDFIDIQQEYLETKSRLAYAKAEYDRHSKLYNDKVYSQKDMEQVTSDYRSLKAQLSALRQKLYLIGKNPARLTDNRISRSVVLTAPISGYIKSVNVNRGKYVSPSDVLFEIVNGDKLFLELTLFEKNAERVSKGQKIIFFINNETEQHKAVVYQTSKMVGDDRSCTVFAKVTDHCKNLIPGLFVSADIESEGNQVTAVPSDAVVNFDDKDYIFVFNRNKKEKDRNFTEYRMVEVRKGLTDEGYTEVELPSAYDARSLKVVVHGAYDLLSAKKNAGEMSC